ncbi:MAG: cation transport regulator ChaB [Proteobacteria bacterium]|nr:cation transport regulator ChaB [Pseudomonadota bacterium]
MYTHDTHPQYAANDNLPHEVQALYLKAFCSVCGSYENFCDLCGDPAREEAARYAWSVVQENYERRGDIWVAKTF